MEKLYHAETIMHGLGIFISMRDKVQFVVSQSNTIEGYLNIETVNKETKGLSQYNGEEQSITLSITELFITADNLSGQICFINEQINISP